MIIIKFVLFSLIEKLSYVVARIQPHRNVRAIEYTNNFVKSQETEFLPHDDIIEAYVKCQYPGNTSVYYMSGLFAQEIFVRKNKNMLCPILI